MLIFYVLAIVIEISRILQYLDVILYLFFQYSVPQFIGDLYLYDVCYVVAIFAKIMMGFFQV